MLRTGPHLHELGNPTRHYRDVIIFRRLYSSVTKCVSTQQTTSIGTISVHVFDRTNSGFLSPMHKVNRTLTNSGFFEFVRNMRAYRVTRGPSSSNAYFSHPLSVCSTVGNGFVAPRTYATPHAQFRAHMTRYRSRYTSLVNFRRDIISLIERTFTAC